MLGQPSAIGYGQRASRTHKPKASEMNAGNIDRFFARRRRAKPFYSALEGMRMLRVSGGDIRVRVSGAGPHTVVFVCDMPVMIEHYERLSALLEPRYRVVCMELPGMGFSVPGSTFGFGLLEQAGVVEQVLRALGVSGCTLAFSCVNGYLALLLAQRATELVSRVVVLQTPSWEEQQRWARRIDFREKGWVATPVLGQVIVALGRRALARRWFGKVLSGGSDAAEFSARAEAGFDAGCSWALASLTQAYFSAAAPVFSPILQPALVIWGAQDRTHRRTDKPSVLQYFRDAESITFQDAGHAPELEQPALFVEHLVRLIEQR
jgi:pimeloyl-ACP methyl ester carboxylesterase